MTAAAALVGLRAAMITCAPMPASSTAVSLPIPLLPPVITATWPSSAVTLPVRSFAALGLRSSPGCAFTHSISSSRWKRISRPPGKRWAGMRSSRTMRRRYSTCTCSRSAAIAVVRIGGNPLASSSAVTAIPRRSRSDRISHRALSRDLPQPATTPGPGVGTRAILPESLRSGNGIPTTSFSCPAARGTGLMPPGGPQPTRRRAVGAQRANSSVVARRRAFASRVSTGHVVMVLAGRARRAADVERPARGRRHASDARGHARHRGRNGDRRTFVSRRPVCTSDATCWRDVVRRVGSSRRLRGRVAVEHIPAGALRHARARCAVRPKGTIPGR